MADIVIDTHIAIWYFADAAQLSKPAETAIDQAETGGIIFVSAITIVELIYLTEKGRIRPMFWIYCATLWTTRQPLFVCLKPTAKLPTKLKTFPVKPFPKCPTEFLPRPLCI